MDDQTVLPRLRSGSFWQYETSTLNGPSEWTERWASAVGALTSRDLRYLTMVPWGHVFGPLGLLQKWRAWCPLCYEEWKCEGQMVYDPLIWTLAAVHWCPVHHQPLATGCPSCGADHQPVLSANARVGYCSVCGCWLGNRVRVVCSGDDGQPDWENSAARLIGDLLKAGPRLSASANVACIGRVVAASIAQLCGGNQKVFGLLFGLTPRTVSSLRRALSTVQLMTAVIMAFQLGLSLVELVTAEDPKLTSLTINGYIAQRTLHDAPHPSTTDISHAKEALESALDSEQRAQSVKKVATDLGVEFRRLERRYPDLCAEVSHRYRQAVCERRRCE